MELTVANINALFRAIRGSSDLDPNKNPSTVAQLKQAASERLQHNPSDRDTKELADRLKQFPDTAAVVWFKIKSYHFRIIHEGVTLFDTRPGHNKHYWGIDPTTRKAGRIMAKAAKADKVNPTDLMAELTLFGERATAGMDALLEQIKDFKAEAEREKFEVDEALRQKIAPLQEQITKLDEVYNRTTGRWYVTTQKQGKAKTGTGEGRQRRSAEQMAAMALEVHAFVKSKGKAGVKSSEVIAKFGKKELQPSAIEFVAKHGGGLKLSKVGDKAQTVYHAD